MQRVYEPQDLMEGELLLSMLASEGIEAYLTGQHLAGAVGELQWGGLAGTHWFINPVNGLAGVVMCQRHFGLHTI